VLVGGGLLLSLLLAVIEHIGVVGPVVPWLVVGFICRNVPMLRFVVCFIASFRISD